MNVKGNTQYTLSMNIIYHKLHKFCILLDFVHDEVLQRRVKQRCNVFTVADYGTADGVNFIPLLTEILEIVDVQEAEDTQTMVYLEDQVGNDFNLLISKYENSINEFSWNHNVFFAAIGKSMYHQCLPTGSLDIGISTFALHWTSTRPCLQNGLTYKHADEHELSLYRDQAAKDWKDFLLSRGHELKEGGFLVALIPVEEEGTCSNDFLLCASEAWRRMFSFSKISKAEFLGANLGHYGRSEEDVKLPFSDSEVIRQGLRLVSMKPGLHILKPLVALRQNNDKQTYMNAAVQYVKPFIRNEVYLGLSDHRCTDEKYEIVEEYFKVLYSVFFEANVKLDKLTIEEVIVQKL